ncbi:hypothetical protein PTKIN_Ptkin10aG0058500 [Pterospermum kingtungense]
MREIRGDYLSYETKTERERSKKKLSWEFGRTKSKKEASMVQATEKIENERKTQLSVLERLFFGRAKLGQQCLCSLWQRFYILPHIISLLEADADFRIMIADPEVRWSLVQEWCLQP